MYNKEGWWRLDEMRFGWFFVGLRWFFVFRKYNDIQFILQP